MDWSHFFFPSSSNFSFWCFHIFYFFWYFSYQPNNDSQSTLLHHDLPELLISDIPFFHPHPSSSFPSHDSPLTFPLSWFSPSPLIILPSPFPSHHSPLTLTICRVVPIVSKSTVWYYISYLEAFKGYLIDHHVDEIAAILISENSATTHSVVIKFVISLAYFFVSSFLLSLSLFFSLLFVLYLTMV